MSLEKAIAHGKEHREPYRDSRRFDWTCRAHGGGRSAYPCKWCEGNRLHAQRIFTALLRDPEIKEAIHGNHTD